MKPPVESLDDLLLLEQLDANTDEETEALEAFALRYSTGEEIGCAEKERESDRHRWELDPASSEDYLERLHPRTLSRRWRHFNG